MAYTNFFLPEDAPPAEQLRDALASALGLAPGALALVFEGQFPDYERDIAWLELGTSQAPFPRHIELTLTHKAQGPSLSTVEDNIALLSPLAATLDCAIVTSDEGMGDLNYLELCPDGAIWPVSYDSLGDLVPVQSAPLVRRRQSLGALLCGEELDPGELAALLARRLGLQSEEIELRVGYRAQPYGDLDGEYYDLAFLRSELRHGWRIEPVEPMLWCSQAERLSRLLRLGSAAADRFARPIYAHESDVMREVRNIPGGSDSRSWVMRCLPGGEVVEVVFKRCRERW